ncbi:glycoside hydrolase family 9 protein [Streptomyces sulfonofaciens]|uniref:glycoside hydrolase family 9 protein n=1 Tax=Streptomyces sulfonofaciens TaxID=68272 RepID=UPI001E4D8415|nr:glycoside hydrolase family 9 protein [Streptomyces sulfonofaciens]
MFRLVAALVCAGLTAGALAGSASAVPATPAAGTEEIVNGDFSGGATAPWWWTANNPASVVDGRLCADVPGGTTNPWDAIIGQNDLPLAAGETYALTYTASATVPVTVTTNVQQAAEPYTQYFTSADQLTSEPRTFAETFTAKTDDDAAQLAFQIGGSDEAYTFCVDDVSLTGGAETPPYDPDTGSPVRVNQVGYLPDGAKKGVYVTDSTEPVAWSLKDARGTQRASGRTTPLGVDASSGQNVQSFDFSGVTAPGDGYTVTIGGDTSEPFAIGSDVYAELRKDALQYFYVERSGIEIRGDLVGSAWARPAGHLNVAPNTGDNGVTCVAAQPCGYTLNAAGGWYDAGDQGKYVVNGGIATAQLLSEYERTLTAPGASKAALGDGSLRVPERGNGVPDILDEARWELRFLMSMQVPQGQALAGMAHHKLHDAQWTALPTQPTADDQPRELHPPSTAATLNLAAAAAQGARLFRKYDPAFADKLLASARSAYRAAVAHPAVYAPASDSTGGGAYNDNNVTDEFYWAAAELYLTTGESSYRSAVLGSPLWGEGEDVFPQGGFSWGSTAALGALDLATVRGGLTRTQLAEVRGEVTQAADRYAADAADAAYGMPYAPEGGHWVWGSNSQVLNNAVVLATAADLTGRQKYRNAVLGAVDYVLGNNPMNQSYVTGFGERSTQNQHNRIYANQLDPDLAHPIAGSLAGGPDDSLEDPKAEQKLAGCVGAMCYIDDIESYSTNELAINWNAPLSWVASYVDDLGGAGTRDWHGGHGPRG